MKNRLSSFVEMDRLSQAKIPFFFMIDFLAENIVLIEEKDLENTDIQIKFPNFKFEPMARNFDKKISWETFPIDEKTYKKGFDIVQENLFLGNSYLTNYTCPTEIKTNLNLKEIYGLSDAKYKVYFDDKFTFFSPETFIEIKEKKIFTYPMKGTIDAEINDAMNILKQDKKELAEHYTVVDLLRNDLSIVAKKVRLDEFQTIDFIKTRNKNLYAMSSKISGEMRSEFQGKIGSVLEKLLPAGSILGAPKQKTLEIILEAENYARGFYTGVCGWFDGHNLDSCVMIRFIEKQGEKFFFKSGGGITHQSKISDEYQEMKNKIYVPIH